MRAFISGQVGVDKGPFLEKVRARAAERGLDVVICNVGQMMYAEAPDVPAGRILNLPITRLNALRRAVFKEILTIADAHEHVLINSHATFRWRHGLFAAFDFDQLKTFNADVYITLMDNAERVHERLLRDHEVDHTLKDIMVWREEELLATEIIANITRGYGHFFMLGRGRADSLQNSSTADTVFELIFQQNRKRVYMSFPMSHVMDLPEILLEIENFKTTLREHFVCFDPSDVDEMSIHVAALKALEQGETSIETPGEFGPITLKTADVAQISGDILGQIYARDFKMIDQSEMIVSFVPEFPTGKPALSSGVERELHHAFEGGKEVYVIWNCQAMPSPFITETATKVFKNTEDAIGYFRQKGYLA